MAAIAPRATAPAIRLRLTVVLRRRRSRGATRRAALLPAGPTLRDCCWVARGSPLCHLAPTRRGRRGPRAAASATPDDAEPPTPPTSTPPARPWERRPGRRTPSAHGPR